MRFAQPLWLMAGLFVCTGLLVLYRLADRWRQAALRRFTSQHLLALLTGSVSVGRRRLRQGMVVLGVACVFLALARPQAGFRWEEARRQGIDILFAVDTSKSMLAEDVRPNRLTRAKLAVSDLLRKFQGDRVGLVAFAGDAFLQCPLTLDYNVFQESLDALDAGIIPRGGTDIAGAIHEAQTALSSESHNHKILVLITDGEELEGNAVDAASAAAKDGLKIFTVGVGSPAGELIPVNEGQGKGTQFLHDSQGQLVKSRLDEAMLGRIAEVTGGMYQPLGQQGEGLEAIYRQSLSLLPKQELASRMNKVYFERFQLPLLLGLILLLLEPLIGERRRSRGGLLVALALLALPSLAQASPQSAERDYKKGDYAAAKKQYEQAASQSPDRPELQFNLGGAAYKSGSYTEAEAAFGKTLLSAPVPLQEQSYYNLGNTQYRIGQQTEQKDKQKTIQTWQQAIQAYESALKLRPEDADAKFNRDFVKRKLDELQKQQDQQKQQDKRDQKDQKNQQDQKGQNQKQDQKGPQGQNQKQDQGKQDQQKDQGQNQQQAQQKPGQKPEEKPGDKPGDKKDGQPQPASAGQEPKPEPEPNNDKDQGQHNAEAQAVPGQMTKEEAKNLFDSLKNEGRRMPVTPSARQTDKPTENQPGKDW